MPAKVNEVVAVEIEDKPGSLARMLKPLTEANVAVLYTYAFVGFSIGRAVMIFHFSDNVFRTPVTPFLAKVWPVAEDAPVRASAAAHHGRDG